MVMQCIQVEREETQKNLTFLISLIKVITRLIKGLIKTRQNNFA